MEFYIDKTGSFCNYTTQYSISEQVFVTESNIPDSFAIMIGNGYVGLNVSQISSIVMSISGYSPKNQWKKRKLNFPFAVNKSLKVSNFGHLEIGTGISYRNDWETYYDEDRGIICWGDYHKVDKATNVEFNTDTVASIINNELVAVWMKLQFIK